jgi:PIN domain nuclease of toxin-antitoxin system
MERAVTDLELAILNITVEVTERQSDLTFHHRDPSDRLLVPQCLVDSISLVSTDLVFDRRQQQELVLVREKLRDAGKNP